MGHEYHNKTKDVEDLWTVQGLTKCTLNITVSCKIFMIEKSTGLIFHPTVSAEEHNFTLFDFIPNRWLKPSSNIIDST